MPIPEEVQVDAMEMKKKKKKKGRVDLEDMYEFNLEELEKKDSTRIKKAVPVKEKPKADTVT